MKVRTSSTCALEFNVEELHVLPALHIHFAGSCGDEHVDKKRGQQNVSVRDTREVRARGPVCQATRQRGRYHGVEHGFQVHPTLLDHMSESCEIAWQIVSFLPPALAPSRRVNSSTQQRARAVFFSPAILRSLLSSIVVARISLRKESPKQSAFLVSLDFHMLRNKKYLLAAPAVTAPLRLGTAATIAMTVLIYPATILLLLFNGIFLFSLTNPEFR